MNDDMKYTIWLSTVLRPAKANKLLKSFDRVRDIYNADAVALAGCDFLTKADIFKIMDKSGRRAIDGIVENIYKSGVQVLSILDEDYPFYLKHIYDPPTVIYYKGEIEKSAKCLAIVGSRKATTYGAKMAEVISISLARMGFRIVSGMARGIDSIAHEACIGGDGKTFGILGCGVDVIYPPENRRLTEKIIENGALISEFLPGTKPFAYNFPQRNRIISGMSLGVIVIEAGEKSGSLITANIALEQGREVFALPGNILSTRSIGTNKLIRDGAKIITGIDDILDELYIFEENGYKEPLKKKMFKDKLNSLSLEEKKIVGALESGETHIDELCIKTGMHVRLLSSILIALELNGVIEQIPGKFYRILSTF